MKDMQNTLLSWSRLFKPNESIYVHLSSSLPEYISKLHFHDFIEITYILSGECTHVEYDKQYIGKKGDLFIMNIGTPHMDLINTEFSEPFSSYDITFTSNFLDNALNDIHDFWSIKTQFLSFSASAEKKENNPVLKLTDNAFNEFETLFKKIYDEYTMRKEGYYALLRGYLIELLVKIFRKMDLPQEEKETRQTMQAKYIRFAEQYIRDNYKQKITLEDIAHRSFMSKNYFSQLFKEVTGSCFSDYLQKIRINHACESLKNPSLSIAEISYACGFNDIKFFYNIFKRLMNATPAQYRKGLNV